MVLACFGPKGRSDDKQQHAAQREGAGGNLPAVGGGVLFGYLLLKGADLRAVFRTEIRRWRWIVEEPACMHCGGGAAQQAQKKDEMFHGVMG